jgi:ABC-type antimicrobial peptide transport system permease subunit
MAVTGVYSVMAFLVRTRRRELGVRMACGATRVNVGGLVVRRGLVVATIGSGFGAVAAVSSAGLFQSLLFGVPLADLPSLFMGVGIALVSTTLACLAPALRAATTHPATVLRSE